MRRRRKHGGRRRCLAPSRPSPVRYSGSTSYILDPGGIADDLGPDPTDEQILDAVDADARAWLEYGSDVAPPDRAVSFDRARVLEVVREEIAERAAEEAAGDA